MILLEMNLDALALHSDFKSWYVWFRLVYNVYPVNFLSLQTSGGMTMNNTLTNDLTSEESMTIQQAIEQTLQEVGLIRERMRQQQAVIEALGKRTDAKLIEIQFHLAKLKAS